MLPSVDQIIQNIESKKIDQMAAIRRKTNDLLVVLNLLDLAAGAEDPFQYTKLLFFVDHAAYSQKTFGLNASFFVYTHGAYSKELDQMHHALWSAGALHSDADRFAALTADGARHLATANDITGFRDSAQYRILQEVVANHAGRSGQELLQQHLATVVKGDTIAAHKTARRFNTELYSGTDFAGFPSCIDDLDDAKVLRAFDALAFPETFGREHELEYTETREVAHPADLL